MAGFDARKVLEAVASVCIDLSVALNTLAYMRRKLLAVDPGKAGWEDWDELFVAVSQVEAWLENAREDVEVLKQQLEGLKRGWGSSLALPQTP
jgi:hypothetical protein